MKKLAYLSVFAGLFLTGCIAGDYGIKPADPQMNEQDEILTLAGAVSVAEVAAIDLAAVEADSVAVGTVTVTGLDAADDVKYYVTFDDVYEFEVASDLELSVRELQAMVENAYGKRPENRTFETVVKVNAIVDGTALLYESEAFDVVLKPEAPFISSAYYLIGNMNDWNDKNALDYKFSHSDKDVYADPVFTITFTAGADCYWKIIPQSDYDAGNAWNEGATGVLGVAVDGDTAKEGKLVTTAPQAGKIAEEGMYMMTINMMDYTYSIKALAPEYYLLGDTPFSWNVNDKNFMMYPESKTVMSYTTEFAGNIKFINANDMGTDNWGACYGTPKDGDTALNAPLQQNSGAIHVPETGYYTFRADIGSMTYTWTKVEVAATYKSMAVVGNVQGWNPGNPDTQMKEIAPHNWFISGLEVDAEFKIAANGTWDDSWGENTLEESNFCVLAGGGNCKIVPGTYDILFNDITKQCVVIAK